MKKLSAIAQRLAGEIRVQEWSDVHSRADGARHDRMLDRKGGEQLSPDQTEVVRMNVIWVVGQALAEDDPNFDIRAFAAAAGATDNWLFNKDGGPNRGIEAGLRATGKQ